MNDRILIQTDDENSTWNKQSQSCYVYHRSTGRWSTLTRFNNFYRTWSDRWRLSFNVLNDSLVSVRYGSSLDSIAVWNVDADSMMCKIGRFYVGGWNLIIFHPMFGYIQYGQVETQKNWLHLNTTLIDGSASVQQRVKAPGDSELVKNIIPINSGGFWIQTERALWWTDRFESYVRVMDLRTTDLRILKSDSERIHVVTRISEARHGFASLFTFSSPTQEPYVFEVPQQKFYADFVAVDNENRLWFYRPDADDGFYVVSKDAPQFTRFSQFDKRSGRINGFIAAGSWMVAESYRGLMVSNDKGATWQHVDLPHPTSERIDTNTRIQSVEGGGVMLTNTLYYYRKHDTTDFEIVGTVSGVYVGNYTRWNHRNYSWLRTMYGQVEIGDSRGIWTAPDVQSKDLTHIFNYGDTIYVRWLATYPDTALKIARWDPGSMTLSADPALAQRFESVYTVKLLPGRTVWFGGTAKQYSYSYTGRIESALTRHFLPPLCGNETSVLKATTFPGGGLAVLVQGNGCVNVFALPLNNLNFYTLVQTSLPLEYNSSPFKHRLIYGHDQQLVGILDNKAYILAPDMRSATLHDFVNVTEKRIIDIAYDDVNHVYYVLTERGLYRSDPVVTSVASEESSSDDHRPASGLPLQTTWYNTLGEHVSPPIIPGLYFKIMLTDAGSMVTEKILIH